MKKNLILQENNDKSLILSRIKFAYRFKKDIELAGFLGVSPNTITTWKGRNSIDFELIFAKCENLNYDWLLTGEGEMFRNSTNQNVQNTQNTRILSNGNTSQTVQNQCKDTTNISNKMIPAEYKEGIPLIPINAMAGYFAGEIQISSTDCDYYVVPMFKEAEFLIPVKGSSMIPKYNSGDIVACKHVPLDTFFQWNKVYVLDTEQGALVKRVRKGETDDTLNIVSDNPNYEPFPLHKSKIYAIAIVVGVIRQE